MNTTCKDAALMDGMLTDFYRQKKGFMGSLFLLGTCPFGWVFEKGVGGRYERSIGVGQMGHEGALGIQ